MLHALTEDELRQAFAAYGNVSRVSIIKDRDSGMSRGFGFVHMDDQNEAAAAISALNGSDLKGRRMTVNEARPKAPRENFGGSRGGDRGGYRSGGFSGSRDQRRDRNNRF